jgi:hypothetical protein
MQTMTLTEQQRLRMAELPADYRMIGVDRSAPFVRKPTGQIMRIHQNGTLTSATVAAKHRLADRRGENRHHLAGENRHRLAGGLTQSSDSTLRLERLEATTQAVLATLRRCLIERVPPTLDGLAHEAAIAFDLPDNQQALDMIDEIAQTVGISAFE